MPKLTRKKQKGIFIADAMIGLIIFLIGILGILKFQGDTIIATSQAQYRVTASFLADSLLNSLWLNKSKATSFKDLDAYNNWVDQVHAYLPGSANNEPTLTVTDQGNGILKVDITLNWQSPNGVSSSHTISSTLY